MRDWSPKVTHLITGVDEKGQAKRTLKYLCALLTGQWIVTSQCEAFRLNIDLIITFCECF